MTKSEQIFLKRVARETIETRLYHDFPAVDVRDPGRIAARERMEKDAKLILRFRERGTLTEREAFYSIITLRH